MTVVALALPAGEVALAPGALAPDGRRLPAHTPPELRRALEAAALCNDASLGDGAEGVGDPLELALLAAARDAGLERAALVAGLPELRDVAFDPATKRMATIHRDGDAFRVAVKGAPEAVLAACTHVADGESACPLEANERAEWIARNEAMARRGLRVLALATRQSARVDGEPFAALTLLGLVGLLDPPRGDARAAIGLCRAAGIRVVMATGDQPETARNVALAVGLGDDAAAPVLRGEAIAADPEAALAASIVARATPEQKLALIALHQARGAVVAMTGDGVNDAPALRKADIGVAMGRRGSAVAREAADLVLRDDAFATIAAAVREGRVIFANIRAFVIYLVACNLSEILVVGLAAALRVPLPLLPLQILFLNFVTDVFPALALGASEGSDDVMRRPPRDPREPLLAPSHWRAALRGGAVITACVLGALVLATGPLGLGEREAVTVSFYTLALAQLWHVFDLRSPAVPLWRSEVARNPWVWGALALCCALLGAAGALPVVARALELAPLGPRAVALVAAASLASLALNTGLRAAAAARRAR
jgi:Ca2+-transporting ATPase